MQFPANESLHLKLILRRCSGTRVALVILALRQHLHLAAAAREIAENEFCARISPSNDAPSQNHGRFLLACTIWQIAVRLDELLQRVRRPEARRIVVLVLLGHRAA